MRKFIKIINLRSAGLIIALMVLSIGLKAQQVPLYNQYFQQKFLAYPSASTFAERPALSVIYRGQFSGIEGAPKAYAVSYANKLGTNSGFGLNISGNDIGFISQTKVQGGFAYALLKKGDHSLSFGALAGVSLFSINEDIISPESFNDPLLSDLIGNNGAALGIDLSISYKYKDFGIDVAAPALINESLSDDEYVQINEDNVPDYIAGAYYRIALDPLGNMFLTPNVTWRYRDVIGSEIDVLAKFEYKQKFQANIGYRDNYGPTIGVGINIQPSILFTYNYDFGQADVPFLADGFNEFALHFTFKNKEERLSGKYAEGEAVLNRIRAENIYDKSLIPNTDQEMAIDYLASLESTGSKADKRMAGQTRFDEILDGMRKNEQAKLQAQMDAENAKQQAIVDAQAAAERERLEAERLRQVEIEQQRLAALKEEQKVEVIEKTLSLATESISFNSGNTKLTQSSFNSLDEVAKLLKENPEVKLALSGYTDNTGDAANNLSLSKERAAAVKAYLVSKGIADERIISEGYGIENPRASNLTPEGRALNRRVEMKIVRN